MWGIARQIAPYARTGNFDAGIDSAGNAMVVFVDDTSVPPGVWFSRATDASAWSTPMRLYSGMGSYSINLAVGPDGTALAAWADSGTNPIVTVAAAFRAGAWTAAIMPKASIDNGDRLPRVAVDGNGRGFLLWQQPNASGEPNSVFVQRYDGGWMAPTLIESYTADRADSPSIAMNETGAAMALWTQFSGTQLQLWSRRYDGTAWLTAEMVTSAYSIETSVDPPAIAIDPSGVATAVWSQRSPVSLNNVWGSRRGAAASATWSPPVALEQDNTANAPSVDYVDPMVGVDGNGNAFAMWRKTLSANNAAAYVSSLPASATAWTPTNGLGVQTSTTFPLDNIDLAVSRNGTVIAVWNSAGNEYDIWASVYR
jgi:hypothetical protein